METEVNEKFRKASPFRLTNTNKKPNTCHSRTQPYQNKFGYLTGNSNAVAGEKNRAHHLNLNRTRKRNMFFEHQLHAGQNETATCTKRLTILILSSG